MSGLTFPLTFNLTGVDRLSFGLTNAIPLEFQTGVDSWLSMYLNGTAPPIFDAALKTSLVPRWSIGSGTPTYTRASTAYQEDFEGKQNLVLSGEARMQGARRVMNKVPNSETLTVAAGWTNTTDATVVAGATDPLGGTTAYTLTATAINGRLFYGDVSSLLGAGTNSIWIKRVTGVGTINLQSGTVAAAINVAASVTSSWKRISITQSLVGANQRFFIYLGTSGDAVDIWRPMMEDVTGQANQNPSEYVSVGTLSAPYHGCGVDGAKAFNYLNGNTVASNVVTEATGLPINSSNAKFAVLPGVAGSYFSTPDSAASSITGDIDFRFYVTNTDWTPAAAYFLTGKEGGAGATSYGVYLDTNGTIALRWSADGTVQITKTSTAAPTVSDGTQLWVRVTLDVDNGAAGNDVKFYTSPDNVTWTQLGATVTTAGVTSIFDSTTALALGAYTDGTSAMAGNIYRAQIYNGINGTLAVDFNPNLSTSAQTFTAATGEVWTTNGTARIFGNTNATYGIPAQWDANGPYGYLSEGARADVLGTTAAIRRTMTDVGWVVGATTTVGATTGVDGVANAAALLTFGAVQATNTILFTTVLGAAVRTYSAWVTRDTGTSTVEMTKDGGAVWTDITSQLGSAPKLVQVTTASAANPIVGFRGAGNGDKIRVDFNTLEAATFANPTPIPVNVSKAADVLTYPTAGNLGSTVGSAYAEVTGNSSGNAWIVGDGNAALYVTSGNLTLFDGTANRTGNAITLSSTVQKVAFAWGGAASQIALAGVASASLGFDGSMNFAASFGVGSNETGGQINGTIRGLKVYPVALSSGTLTVLTT